MSKVDDYYKKCATCKNYALGSRSQLKPGVGFRCSKYGCAKTMNDFCNSHIVMAGYTRNSAVTDKDIADAEKMIVSSNTNCFITTMVVEILKNNDLCEMLEEFRDFRNDVLQPEPSYHSILHHYDTIGPIIAEALRNDPNKETVAERVLNDFLKPCVKFIEYGNILKEHVFLSYNNDYYVKAINLYINMTDWLADYYGIDNIFDLSIVYSLEEAKTKGHGYVISTQKDELSRDAKRTLKPNFES